MLKPPVLPPLTAPDLDDCRKHMALKKSYMLLQGFLLFIEHCIRTEENYPRNKNVAAPAFYHIGHDDLVSLLESTLRMSLETSATPANDISCHKKMNLDYPGLETSATPANDNSCHKKKYLDHPGLKRNAAPSTKNS
ncbi:hypothetical protein TNCV_1739871 [Trichonephila clavipes]|nr:hypothetical protein TNCV_1739871 [Trichonephila clavipes]